MNGTLDCKDLCVTEASCSWAEVRRKTPSRFAARTDVRTSGWSRLPSYPEESPRAAQADSMEARGFQQWLLRNLAEPWVWRLPPIPSLFAG